MTGNDSDSDKENWFRILWFGNKQNTNYLLKN